MAESFEAKKERLQKKQREILAELAELRGYEKQKARQADIHIKCVLAGHILETQKPATIASLLKAIAPKISAKHEAEFKTLSAAFSEPAES